jgi:DNA-binding LacI/PurR family transcriptional regulator
MDLLLYNFAQVDARQRIFQQKKLVGKVDGLIVVSLPPTEKEFQSILGLGIPVALLGVPDTRCSSVSIDDVAGAEVATEYLVEMGHRDIAIMVGQDELMFEFKVSSQRRQGFLNVLERHKITFNPNFELVADFDSNTAEHAMIEFLRRKKLPTAIFCESDEMAFGVMRALKKKGLRVPEDMSVIGYDNHDFAEIVGLTTVAQPVQFLGQLVASQIMANIEKPGGKVSQIKVPTSLEIRSSVLDIT